MAESKCPNCGFEFFEVVKSKPRNVIGELFLAQCASCGVVIGVVNNFESEKIIKEMEEKFLKMEELIATLDYNMRIIAGKLGIK